MYTPNEAKISLTPSTQSEILTEIAVLEELVVKFRDDHNTLTELKDSIQSLIEQYHRISVIKEIEDV